LSVTQPAPQIVVALSSPLKIYSSGRLKVQDWKIKDQISGLENVHVHCSAGFKFEVQGGVGMGTRGVQPPVIAMSMTPSPLSILQTSGFSHSGLTADGPLHFSQSRHGLMAALV